MTLGDDLMRMAYLALLLVAISGFLLVEFRQRPGRTTRAALAWALIFAGAIAVAGLWNDISGNVSPRQQVEGHRLEVPLARDGHFHLVLNLNEVPVRFVVDTGASEIALGERDARRIGLEPEKLAFIGQAMTANGRVATAPVTIGEVAVGEIRDRNVPASVVQGGLDRSLLGMSYLRRFARVSFEGDRLVLER